MPSETRPEPWDIRSQPVILGNYALVTYTLTHDENGLPFLVSAVILQREELTHEDCDHPVDEHTPRWKIYGHPLATDYISADLRDN